MARVLFALGYIGYLIGFVVVVVYVFFYRGFVAELRERRQWFSEVSPRRNVDAETMHHLGSLITEKRSSLVSFEREKAPGDIRVCAFGDSFTYGDEVGDEQDFSSMLDALFRERGIRNVQAINFGSSWHGFHQSFVLWERVGRHFGCDFVVLGPRSFQSFRDTRFSHAGFKAPYYLHSRYVLDGDGVRLVAVEGESLAQRFDDYYAFIPRLRYLLYDRNPPIALQSIISDSRTLANPFYYCPSDQTTEALETYRRLFARMAQSGARIILLTERRTLAKAARSIGVSSLSTAKPVFPQSFPYRAPRGHCSSFGNMLIARQLMAYLLQEASSRVPLLALTMPPDTGASDTTYGNAGLSPHKPPVVAQSLYSFDRLSLSLGGRGAGLLFRASASFFEDGSGRSHDVKWWRSLLIMVGRGQSLLSGAFLPTPYSLTEGEEVTLNVDFSSGMVSSPLGKVTLLEPRVQIGVLRIDGLDFDPAGTVYLRGPASRLPGRKLPTGQTVGVFLAGKPVLLGEKRADALRFDKGVMSIRKAAVSGPVFFRETEYPTDGLVEIIVERGPEILAIPLARYTTRHIELAPLDPPLGARLRTRGDGTVEMVAGTSAASAAPDTCASGAARAARFASARAVGSI